MTVKDTSIEAYKELKASGRADIIEGRILSHLIQLYPMGKTRMELCEVLKVTVNTMSGRVNTLLNRDWVEDEVKRKCRVTGNMVREVRAICDPQQVLF